MRKRIFCGLSVAAVALVLLSGAASAQGPRTRPAADPAARREALKAHREELKAKLEAMTPEQRAALKADRAAKAETRKELAGKIKDGTIDRKTAAEKLKERREARKAKP